MHKFRKYEREALVIVHDMTYFGMSKQPPLIIGSIVILNSGGPTMVVVDVEGMLVTACYYDEGDEFEITLHKDCFHRQPLILD